MIAGSRARAAWRAGAGAALGLALVVLVPAPEAAAGGISIGWGDCRPSGAPGLTNQTFGCQSTIVELPLFPGFSLDAPVDSVIAIEMVIDVDVAQDPLPDWWRMDPGQCRQGGWAADAAPSSGCSDAWSSQGVASFQGWIPGTPGNSTRHGRLLVAAAPQSGQLAAFEASTAYTACRVLLRTNNTISCDGCAIPACLVFNSLLIRRLPGTSVEEVLLVTPETAGSNLVQWQGGASADCLSVPVRRRTWGAIKALYR